MDLMPVYYFSGIVFYWTGIIFILVMTIFIFYLKYRIKNIQSRAEAKLSDIKSGIYQLVRPGEVAVKLGSILIDRLSGLMNKFIAKKQK